MLEVISIVQLHIRVCLPNIDNSHFDKMATILQEKLIYFAAVRGRYRGGPGGLDPLLGQHFDPPFKFT